MGFWNTIKGLFSRGDDEDSAERVETLRADFQARYHHFKLLLTANNAALERMSEIEESLRGHKPFGMNFVRSRVTACGANVFKIVSHLIALKPGDYDGLIPRFKEINEAISRLLAPQVEKEDGPLVLPLDEVDLAHMDQVGGKMANLGELRNKMRGPVPNGFVITARAYRYFMRRNDLQTEIDRRIQATESEGRMDQLFALSASLQNLIINAEIPKDLEEQILEQTRRLVACEGENVRLALRSSALGEDAAGASFAGQYQSQLNVSCDNVIQSYKEIAAGKYSVQAMNYRLSRGMRDEDVAMCVGCIPMIQAVSGGVAYTRNPVNIRDATIYINSIWGLPKAVVDGSEAVDLFLLDRDPLRVRERVVPVKTHKYVCLPEEGVCRMEMAGAEQSEPSLSDERVLELAALCEKIEQYYKSPQDIEWAVQGDGRLLILQSRPLAQTEAPSQDEEKTALTKTAFGEPVLRGGVTASPGVGAGEVFILRKDAEALAFPEGGVLVVSQARPRFAALLNKASAVVTEQGSITGHLANVAREFRVPAIFGLENAMEFLQSGALVTVDADGRAIYGGRVEGLLALAAPPANLMQGSPVHTTLAEIGKHILPLNLIDPDGQDFKPRYCQTLHDITRFCHEKAVIEMFQFGVDHHFPERSSKQLFYKVAMQFWLIDLDDGFIPGGPKDKRFVLLDEIVSIPMLALWEGMSALPWDGPPPVDAKGFMSVLMEATTNPNLDPCMPSHYSVRNYFMVSKHFCSLQSRFGFHFSTVETLVGERSQENYISFSFKGGAANFERRRTRAILVSEVLEEWDFRTELREDAVFARVEGYEQAFMEDRLKVLGYLAMHTRQIDMVMADPAQVAKYAEKIRKDIDKILGMAHTNVANSS
jgi:pyruvate,water dikinase